MADLDGLSDFGLTAETQSSALGRRTPRLAELLATARQAEQLTAQIQATQQASPEGFLSRLLSPAGIATLLGTGIAGAAGGGQAALAFGAGGLGQIQQQIAAEEEARQNQLKGLRDERDKALDRSDKAQQRIATAINTNPELFIDPETGQSAVDPTVLGMLALGVDIQLFPETRRIMNRRDKRWEKLHSTLTDVLGDAASVEDARVITRAIFNNMEWFEAPQEVIESIARGVGAAEFPTDFANMLIKHGGPTALDAMIFAGENGLPLQHPDVLRMIRFGAGEDSDLLPSQRINLRWLELQQEMNQFNRDNRELVAEIRANTGGDAEEFTRQIAQAAFEGRQADIDEYLDKNNVPRARDLVQMIAAYADIIDKFGLAEALLGIKKTSELQTMTDEDRLRYFYSQASKVIKGAKDAAFGDTVIRDAILLNNSVSRIQIELQLSPEQASLLAGEILKDAKTNAGDNRAKFETELERLTSLAIQQLKQKREQ